MKPAPYYDPFSYEIDDDPYPVWRRLRDEAPLYWNDEHRFFALSRFDDVMAASLDWQSYSSARGTVLELLDLPQEYLPDFLIFKDPPAHDRLRRLVNRGFTPRRIGMLEDRIREIAAGYLDRFGPGDQFDFVQDFGAKLPMMVIGSMLGIPEEDQDQIRMWSDDGLHLEEGESESNLTRRYTEGDAHQADPAIDERFAGGLSAYLERHVATHRERPADDLTTILIDSEIETDEGGRRPLTAAEILDFIGLLAGAGNETVARLLGWAGAVLPQHPEQLARLVGEPSRIPAAIEELLRFEPPSPVQARLATRDQEWHGTRVPAGAKMLLLTGAAGRDEREYPDPDAFDIGRGASRHLSFGYGTHFCLGASLARLEARIALEELLARFPKWTVDFDAAERVHTSTVRGYLRLPVQV